MDIAEQSSTCMILSDVQNVLCLCHTASYSQFICTIKLLLLQPHICCSLETCLCALCRLRSKDSRITRTMLLLWLFRRRSHHSTLCRLWHQATAQTAFRSTWGRLTYHLRLVSHILHILPQEPYESFAANMSVMLIPHVIGLFYDCWEQMRRKNQQHTVHSIFFLHACRQCLLQRVGADVLSASAV